MTLVKYEPFRELEAMTRRMNDLFRTFEESFFAPLATTQSFTPRVDISEDEKNIYITAELPGMSKEDIEVTINEDGVLTIRGEKKREHKEEGENYIRVERVFGSFTRSFVLPENVKTEEISGKFDNGVLRLTLPKAEVEKPNEVKVEIK